MPRLSPTLSRRRIWAAFIVAVLTDLMQMVLGPFGWVLLDQALDGIAMVLTIAFIGFHPLLLPTFVLELLPGVDLVPTWTASVALLVALRTKQAPASAVPAASYPGRVIDV